MRWSTDGGKTWLGNVHLWDKHAYSYSGLTHVPTSGFIGLAWETVLPNSGYHKRDISTNNVLFTLMALGELPPEEQEAEAAAAASSDASGKQAQAPAKKKGRRH